MEYNWSSGRYYLRYLPKTHRVIPFATFHGMLGKFVLFLFLAHQYTESQNRFQDSFFFLGRHDSSMINLCLSFLRPTGISSDSNTFFDGWLYWKNHWIRLSPQYYSSENSAPRVLPPNPAFDFSWTQVHAPGKFRYQLNPIHFEIFFNPLLPLHSDYFKKHKLEFFLSNATFLGKKHKIPGVFLYVRQRLTLPKDSTFHLLPFPQNGIFSFLNSRFGESFLLWKPNPFIKSDSAGFLLKLKYNGDVIHTHKDLDGISTGVDTLYAPAVDTAWEFSSPLLDLVFKLRSKGFSDRKNHRRLHAVRGQVYHDRQYQRLTGFIWEFNRLKEERRMIHPPEEKEEKSSIFQRKKFFLKKRK